MERAREIYTGIGKERERKGDRERTKIDRERETHALFIAVLDATAYQKWGLEETPCHKESENLDILKCNNPFQAPQT